MHLAFAITEYFPYGGAQMDFISVVREMAKRGHQISIVTLLWHGEFPAGWTLYELGKSGRFSNHSRIKSLSDYLTSLKSKQLFDVVIGFTKLQSLDIYFAADPCFTANRMKGVRKLLPRYQTYANIERRLFSNPELKVFFLTDFQRQQYRDCFDVQDVNQALLPVCVDKTFHYTVSSYQQARAWRDTTQPEAGRLVLLFVAADFKTKGLDRIATALEKLPRMLREKFALWIVGDGKKDSYAPSFADLDGLNYTFWGGQSDLSCFYFAADYLIHPARKEAAGMVLAEAAAARLPAIVTDICGYAFLAKECEQSFILDETSVISELSAALKQVSSQTTVDRCQPSTLVSDAVRAEICSDQIERWCQL